MMRVPLAVFIVVIGGVWCLPTKVEDPQKPMTKQTSLAVKDHPDLQVLVSEADDGKIGVEVFQGQGSARTRIPTHNWRVPANWRAPGQDSLFKVVHAELLSTGQVVIVLYSPQKGFDVIVLPVGILEAVTDESLGYTTSPHPILFPNHTVPWHPTVPTKAVNWEWVSNKEAATPNPKPYAVPEKVSVINY